MEALFLLWLISLSLLFIVLCVLFVIHSRKQSKMYYDVLNLRARMNTLGDKGDPIRRAVRPLLKDPEPVEFNFKELTRGDSFENIPT